eukprot:355279-Chlamydomonas_euryale.AAC.7
MAVLSADATSQDTFQGRHGSRLQSWSQALSAWQLCVGFRKSLWGPFKPDADCGVPCAMDAKGATCNMCVHDADLRHHQRAACALAFAVAAKRERRFERATGLDLGLSTSQWPVGIGGRGGGSPISTRASSAVSLCPRTGNVVYP